jgi:hypothetical protein
MTEHEDLNDGPVLNATGSDYATWFALLDDLDATTMSHRDIAAHLVEQRDLPGWWAQHVTVAYERVRGMRALHQTSDGYSISKSKTIPVPVEAAYRAVVDDEVRSRWLDGVLEISSTKAHRTVNGRWEGGPERVTIAFTAKGEDKTQVALGHLRLPTAEAAVAAKVAWEQRLRRLAELLTA